MGGLSFLLAAIAAAAPATQDCRSALGPLYDGAEESALPGQVDGTTLAGAQALVELRRSRADSLIVVRGGDFTGADFQSARLHNICFVDSKLPRSIWRGALAAGVGFIRADLTGADLSGAVMPGVLFRNAQMAGADASGADFAGGRLDGGWWQGSVENLRLDGADLTGFRFECGITLDDGCPIDGEVSAARANLSGAALRGFSRFANITGARIDGTEIGPDQLEALAEANLAGPIVVRGGEASAQLAPTEYRALLPRIRRPGEAPSPAFDCARAASAAERTICGNDGGTLRALDLTVDRLYRQALAVDPAISRSQTAWLRERDRCPGVENGGRECLQSAYERRREALIARLGPPSWFTPGTTAVFIGPVVEFDPQFHAEPLYRRLLPVMIGASWSKVLVRVNEDGTIDARGDAVGANAHLCSLGGESLFRDRSGWFSGPYDADADDAAEWRDRPMPVLLFWDERAMVYQHGRASAGEGGDPRFSDYASCGMRASFDELIRVPVTEEEANALFNSYESEE